ncbi:hypothetical protein J3R03_004246 [Actinoplanes couchii]|uniref:Uncharacterized protein n=1 Tax=Actinoplanes couchii TaxID=403638 RepID=A0ABQ3XRF9_9ACTN|nr:hypothetical protein [Actinoplanes couchii]GID61088.1 hypothetical protein Aco03nite_094920 [Actinoplanes couchii]
MTGKPEFSEPVAGLRPLGIIQVAAGCAVIRIRWVAWSIAAVTWKRPLIRAQYYADLGVAEDRRSSETIMAA